MRSIADAATALGTLGTASFQRLGQQATAFWKRLMGAGRDLAYRPTAGNPGDHVPAVGNVDPGLILTTFDSTSLMDRVQFRVQRPTEDVKG